MAFNKNNNQNEKLETINQNTNDESIVSKIFASLPLLALNYEQLTGKKVPHLQGTIGEILFSLQRIETKLTALESKIDDLERNCDQQFTLQEQQLNNIQQVTKLVSTEKTKAIHFGNKQLITEE